MAEAVVTIALETLGDVLLEEGRFLLGVQGEVNALQTQLKEIKCLLKDADAKQHRSETVRNWIAEIRDLAYRAEDVVAEYSIRMSSSSSSYGWGRRLVRRFSGVLHCFSLHQLGSEMLDVKSELARVTNEMKAYGIRNIIDVDEATQNLARKTFPYYEIGDCFVGMEDDLKLLASLLVDDEQHRVISVWGMGGIGKTTIAKKVYNQMKEAKHFDCFAWVCISQQCQIRSVLEEVLKKLTHESEGVSSLTETQLIEELCEVQRAKRCLIVVDDLWQTSHWDEMKHAFLVQNLQSKILVTTRKQKVADIGFPLQLGLLNMDEGWELLKNKAFPHGHIPDVELHEIGKEMIQKCGCLPLAISLLGGILSRKNPNTAEWELVNKNMNAFIYGGEELDEKGSSVLNLSYEDLPYHLKPCFLYLGIFKEDKTIRVDKLYKSWIAQGMVSNENTRGTEDSLTEVAELYLGELASRCMVQVEFDDVNVMPTQKQHIAYCKLHDVVRELCLSIGKKEEFGVEVLEYRDGKFRSLLPQYLRSTNKTQHLDIHFQEELQLEGGGDLTITTCKRLRSFRILKWYDMSIPLPPKSMIDFEKFKMLRELFIENFSFEGRKLPRGITKLVHLRYLGLRACVHLDELPTSISNLAYLDTLDLCSSYNIRVPNVFKKMLRLKHLILPFYHDEKTIGKYRLKLDEGVNELETLEGFDSRVHELKSTVRMKNLQHFKGDIYDNESLLAIVNHIATTSNKLQNCSLSIQEGCELTSEEGLMKLKQAFTCPNLHTLEIFVRTEKLPDNDILSSKLMSLSLYGCEIEDDPLGILGKLHCLTQLKFFSGSYVGEEMTCPASSFPRLKELVLFDLAELREWRVEQGAMALLSDLDINNCPNLREWRVEQGAMPLLSQLIILDCPGLKKVPDGVSSNSADDKLHIIRLNLMD